MMITEKSFSFQGHSIFYRVAGTGKPVLLIHGFAETGDIWKEQVDFLAANCRLIIPDLPGSGLSPLIAGADIDTYAAVMKALLDYELSAAEDELREQPIAVGHSMGGYITLAMAQQYPGLLKAFCLFHSSAFADDEAKKETRLKAIRVIKEKGAAAFLRTTIPGLFTSEYGGKPHNKMEELIALGKEFSDESLVQYYEAMIQRPDRTSVLKTFDGAIMFVMGKHDTAIPLEVSLQQCHLPAVSKVVLLEQSAHMGMLEETAKANQLLLEFIS